MIFKVKNRKCSILQSTEIIGDNSDYTAEFQVDSEWENVTKTARFISKGNYYDAVLDSNNRCTIPSLKESITSVGLYSSTMSSTKCNVHILPSIKEKHGTQASPTTTVYEQILARLDDLAGNTSEAIATAVSNYLIENPVETLTENEVETIVNGIIEELDIHDGQDGVSPTVSTTSITGGTRLTITDANGEHTVDILNGINGTNGQDGSDGTNGQDGVSPTITKTEIQNGTRLTIEDVNGVETVDILNGVNGTNGQNGLDGTNGVDGKSLEFDWDGTKLGVRQQGQSSYNYVDLKGATGQNGTDGNDGNDGQNGVSPTVSTTSITGGTRLTITDVNGEHTIEIMNGSDGQNGSNGSNGNDGKSLEFNWNGTELGIRQEGDANYSYVDLKGATGSNGTNGTNGVGAVIRIDSGYIQYKDADHTVWTNLIALSDITSGYATTSYVDTAINTAITTTLGGSY